MSFRMVAVTQTLRCVTTKRLLDKNRRKTLAETANTFPLEAGRGVCIWFFCSEPVEEPRDRSKKFVPAWCKNYLEELQRQADVDPDSIFGNRVPQCCLEDIFTDATYKQACRHNVAVVRES
eukprot:2972383-Amphidinium_carterae.1